MNRKQTRNFSGLFSRFTPPNTPDEWKVESMEGKGGKRISVEVPREATRGWGPPLPLQNRITFLGVWFIAVALIAVWVVPPASAQRELDLYLYSHKKDSETDYILKLYEPQGNKWYTHSGTEKSDNKYEVARQGNEFRNTLLGEEYVKGMDKAKSLQAIVDMPEPERDGQWGADTWLMFIKFLEKQAIEEKAIKEITQFSDLGVEKLTYINVNQLLGAAVSEENLRYLIQFSTDKKGKLQVSQLISWLNDITKLKLPQSFDNYFTSALANKRADIAKWAATERKVISIGGFVEVLDKGYTRRTDATDELMQLVSLLEKHKIEASDPYKTLLLNYIKANEENVSMENIPFLKNESLTAWQQVVKTALVKRTKEQPWWHNPLYVAVLAVVFVVLVSLGIVLYFIRKRPQPQPYDSRTTGEDVLREAAGEVYAGMEFKQTWFQKLVGKLTKPSEKSVEPEPTSPNEVYETILQRLEGLEEDVKRVKLTLPKIATQVKTAVENQLQISLSNFNQSVEDVRKLAVGVNESIDQRVAQLDKIAAQKITDAGEQMHRLADDSKDELTRKAAEAGEQLDDKRNQIQTTLEDAQGKIDLMVKNVYEHIDAWKKLIDENHVEEIQQHLKFGEILEGWNTDFNAVLDTLTPESSKQLPEFEGLHEKVGKARALVSAIVEEACFQFSVKKDKFGTILDDLDRLEGELNQAVQLYQPLSEPEIESFNEYYNSLGGDIQPNESIYCDYLRKLSDGYRDYFKKATDKLKILLEVKGRPDDYFSKRFERFATNNIVYFTYVLDDVIKNSGVSPTDSIEKNLQKLFNIVGLQEIEVTEKKDKYDVTLHEPVRWTGEGNLESDTIIQLVRRGFVFRNKVLRRARVVVRQ